MKKDHANTRLSEKNRGFSLIEVLIALAIFSIGIMAVGSLQLSNYRNNTTGNITTQATMLGRQKIEELRAVQDLDDIEPGNDTVGIYLREWDRGPISGIIRPIWVEVSWGDRTVRLDTITIRP
jgi:prepilin-type N-terminal cleavage/methylation domain-containing protein